MSLHLFDNYSAVWSSTADSAVETGNRFAVSNDATLDELRWYRRDTTSGHKPEVLRCWDLTTHAVIATAASVPDNGTIGWQTAVAPDAITLLPGHVYCVTAYWPDGTTASNRGLTSSPIVSKPAPLIASGNTRGYHGTTLGEPTSSDSVFAEATDVGITDLGPGEGAGSGTLTGDLNSWLNTSAPPNVHDDDGLPWRTDANVTLLREAAEGSSGFAAIKGVADTIAANAATLLTRWSAALATTVQTTSDNVATLLTRWSASLATALQTMSDNFATFFNTVGGTAGGPTGALSGRTAFPTELWTLIDETDFDFQISWDVPADLYTISLTGIPSRINTVDVDGATWRPRVGWWALRNGDLLGARSFLSWENEYVEDGGRRIPGIVIRTQPEIAGHVQAWRLT